ncbi:MAG: hypothetical protein AB1420_14165 [Bacillota bacterium]
MWLGWTFERILIVYIFIAFAGLAVQVFLFHYRGNLRHLVMYGPVLLAPTAALLAGALIFFNLSWIRAALAVVLGIGALFGLLGFMLHVRGVSLRVGGWQMNNVLTGPPIVLPVLFAGQSLIGLVILYWRVLFR